MSTKTRLISESEKNLGNRLYLYCDAVLEPLTDPCMQNENVVLSPGRQSEQLEVI